MIKLEKYSIYKVYIAFVLVLDPDLFCFWFLCFLTLGESIFDIFTYLIIYTCMTLLNV